MDYKSSAQFLVCSVKMPMKNPQNIVMIQYMAPSHRNTIASIPFKTCTMNIDKVLRVPPSPEINFVKKYILLDLDFQIIRIQLIHSISKKTYWRGKYRKEIEVA